MAPFPESAVVTLPVPAKQLLDLQESTAFRTLLAQVTDREEEVVDVWHEGDVRYERVRNIPDYEKWVPAIGRKYVKPKDIEFIDIIEYDPRQMAAPPYRLRISTKLPSAGDRVKMERTVVIEDAGAGQCRYRITGSVKVKMFGIGHLVEKQVMSNSVDSLGLLAQVVDRFQRVRGGKERPAGAGAMDEDDDGPPDDANEMSRVSCILQEPYKEPPPDADSGEDTESEVGWDNDDGDDSSSGSSSSSTDDSRWGLDPSSASSSRGSSPPGTPAPVRVGGLQLARQETVFHDAGELLVDADAPMADVDAATAAAMQRDLRRVNTRAQHGGPRLPGDPVDHVHLGVRERHRRRRQERAARKAGQDVPDGLADGRHRHRRHRHRARTRTEEDSARVARWRRDKERWQRFWARVQPREAPRRTGKLARLANLLRLGEAVGWVKVHAHRRHGAGDADGEGSRRGFRQCVKDKWHDISNHGKGRRGSASPELHAVAAGEE